jgi:hypothetical protein
MPTHAAVGQSTSRSARDAGREATVSALLQLSDEPRLLLVFATTGYDQGELLAGVNDVGGDAPVSGCSAEGVIAQHLSDEGSHAAVVMAVASDKATFVPFLAEGLTDSRACGRALAEQIAASGAEGRCLLLFPDGMNGNCTTLLGSLQEALPYPLLVAGGAAGAAISTERTTYQYFGREVRTDAVAAVLIGGDVSMETALSHGSMPIGVARTVTRSDGGTVYEIDGRPAWEVLREYLDGNRSDLSIADSLHLAFAEKVRPGGDGRPDEYIMHTPWGLDAATGALFFPGGLREGVRIQIARRDPDRIREGATAEARALAARAAGRSPSLVLHFDCAGRGRVIFGEQATATTVASMQSALGTSIPWLGFYTYGEIAPFQGEPERAVYHNHTVVLCALYDAAPS